MNLKIAPERRVVERIKTTTFLLVLATCMANTSLATTCHPPPFYAVDRVLVPYGALENNRSDSDKPALFLIDQQNNVEWKHLAKAWSTTNFLTHFGATLVHTITPFEIARYGPSSNDLSGRPKTVKQVLSESNAKNNDDAMVFANEKSRLTQLVLEKQLPAAKWISKQLPVDVAARSFISVGRSGQGLPFHKPRNFNDLGALF